MYERIETEENIFNFTSMRDPNLDIQDKGLWSLKS